MNKLKKNIYAVLAVTVFMAGVAGASCMGPFCWDDQGAYINARANVTTSGIRITSTETITVGVSTPTASGLLGFDATYVMYVSTGTGRGAWVKIGGQ